MSLYNGTKMESQLNMIDFITNFARGFINIQLKEQERKYDERFAEQEKNFNERFTQQEKNFNERFAEQERQNHANKRFISSSFAMNTEKVADQESKINERFADQEIIYDKKIMEQARKYDELFADQEIIYDKKIMEQARKINEIKIIGSFAMNAEIATPNPDSGNHFNKPINTSDIYLHIGQIPEYLPKFYQLNLLYLNLAGGRGRIDTLESDLNKMTKNTTITEIIIRESTGSYSLGGTCSIYPESQLGVLEWMFAKFPNLHSLTIPPSVIMPQNIGMLINLLNEIKHKINLKCIEMPSLQHYMRSDARWNELVMCCKRLNIKCK